MPTRWTWPLLMLAWAMPASAQEPGAPPNFEQHVKPVFRAHCAGCHNFQKKRGGLVLEAYAGVMEGGSSGSVIEPGDVEGSRLWHLINHDDEPAMPPDQDPIPQPLRDLIRDWIAAGAIESLGGKPQLPKKSALAFESSTITPGQSIVPQNICRQPIEVVARPAAVPSIACSPVAPVLAIAAPQQIVLYHVDTGAPLGILPFPDGMPEALKFSSDGRLLMAAGGQNSRRGWAAVFDVRDGRLLAEVGDELDTVLAADISLAQNNPASSDAAASRAASDKIALGGPQRLLRVYSLADGSLLHESNKHHDWVLSAAYSPDGTILASADRGGAILLWEADTGRELRPLNGHTAAVNSLSWRADSKVLASASEDGTVRLWNVANGKQIRSLTADAKGVRAVVIARDGRLLTSGRDRHVKLWSADGKPAASFGPLPDVGLCVAINSTGSVAVAGDWQGHVRAWNTETKAQLRAFVPNPPPLQQQVELAQAALTTATTQAQEISNQMVTLRDQLAAAVRSHEHAISETQQVSDELTRLAERDTSEDDAVARQQAVEDVKQRAERSAKSIHDLVSQRAELTQQIDAMSQEHQRSAVDAEQAGLELTRLREALLEFESREARLARELQSAEMAMQKAAARLNVLRRVEEAVKESLTNIEENRELGPGFIENAEREIAVQAERVAQAQATLDHAQSSHAVAKRELEYHRKVFSNR